MSEETIFNAIPYLMSETEAILTAMKNILLTSAGDHEMELSLVDFLDFMVDPHQRFPLARLMNDPDWQHSVVRRVMNLPLRICEIVYEDEESSNDCGTLV